MFFEISKITGFFLNPVFWVFTLLLIGLLVKNKRRSKRMLWVSLALFYFFSNAFIADEFVRMWEYPDTPVDTTKKYTAAIILSGNIINEDKKQHKFYFRENTDRLLQALALYHSGKVNTLIVSGGSGNLLDEMQTESLSMRRFLTNVGIPKDAVFADSLSRNTHENACYSKELTDKIFPNGHYLLLTSAMHMRRAKACFIKEEVNITPYVTNRIAGHRKGNIMHLFVPHLDSFKKWYDLIHEMIGFLAYKIAGYC